MLKKTVLILIEILLITFLNVICFSQTNSQKEVIEATTTCGYAAAIFDSFVQGIEANKIVIVISYKGNKDSQNKIVTKRLNSAKIYLTEYHKGSPLLGSSDKIVTAIGTDKTKEGKLDFYIDGKLRLTMLFLRNRNFALSSCYSEYKE